MSTPELVKNETNIDTKDSSENAEVIKIVEAVKVLDNQDTSHKKNLIELDKKVIIKEQKEKNKNKTYVFGLSAIEGLEKRKALDNFAKLLKNKFGCGCKIEPDEKRESQSVLVFQGNHKLNISRFIKEQYPKVIVS